MIPEKRLAQGRLEERFEESKPLYTHAEAVAEANRCLYCYDAPCIKACPTSIDIPTFIRKIATDNVTGAAKTILTANTLGYSCGRACPVEELCAGSCVYNGWGREPIAIGRLQHYAVEGALKKNPRLFVKKAPTGKKIALVGAGPASVAAAGMLALEGHKAVILERKSIPGGLNTLGIAPYKMSANEALAELEWVMSLGDIELRSGVEVVAEGAGPGQVNAGDLLRDYDAVFLGLGLGGDTMLDIVGAEGEGVIGATDMIERIKSDPFYKLDGVKRALVIGGGNTAIDAARELAELGVPDVAMVYRRSRAEMSAYDHEIEGARVAGVRVIENRVPVSVSRVEGKVSALLVAEAKEGRAIPGANHELPADLIVLAIGQNRATAVAKAFPGVQLDSKGRVAVDPNTHRTANPKVWSGGDCVNGGKEVVNAAAEAKVAVRDICAQLAGASANTGAASAESAKV